MIVYYRTLQYIAVCDSILSYYDERARSLRALSRPSGNSPCHVCLGVLDFGFRLQIKGLRAKYSGL